jgi:hypothetical protein
MQSFTYNNVDYKLESIVLLKYRSRILQYKIIKIDYVENDCYIVKCKSLLYDNFIQTITFKYGTTNKYIKKYFIYDKPPDILCKTMRKKELVYSFYCEFCKKYHKHNYIGHNDCRCNCIYSPYYSSGYNLILEDKIENFNDYLLFNLKLLLKKNNYKGWSTYICNIKRFYLGNSCDDYGKKNFPYINENMISYIKRKYTVENTKCLVAGLKYLKKMILNKNILYQNMEYKNDLNKLYKFYKKSQPIEKHLKIELLKKIIRPTKTQMQIEEKTQLKSKEKTQVKSKEKTQVKLELKKNNNINVDSNINVDNNINKINNIKNEILIDEINTIELDLLCGIDYIENMKFNHIKNIKEMINTDYPYYKDKYFYYPEDIKIYAKYLDIYEDIYLCITKLETDNITTLFCVDEADCYDIDFINYKQELKNNMN